MYRDNQEKEDEKKDYNGNGSGRVDTPMTRVCGHFESPDLISCLITMEKEKEYI